MDTTRPISSRTRAKRDLRYQDIVQQRKKGSRFVPEREAKKKDCAEGPEWVPVDAEGGEYLVLGFDVPECVSACNGSNGSDAEEIEGVGSASSVKTEMLELERRKRSKIGDLGGSNCGSSDSSAGGGKLGLKKKGAKSTQVDYGKMDNPSGFDRGSSTKSTKGKRSEVGVEEFDNVGPPQNVGHRECHNLDDDDHGSSSEDDDNDNSDDDDEVLVLGESWCPNENRGDRVSTIILDSSSDSEVDRDVAAEAVSCGQVRVKKSIEGRNLKGKFDIVSDRANKVYKDDEDEDEEGIQVRRKRSKCKDSSSVSRGENEVTFDLSELESSSSEDNDSSDMEYEMDQVTDSISCEQSDSDSELEGEVGDDEDCSPTMKDGAVDCGLRRKRAYGLEILVDDSKEREEGDSDGVDEEINCVARRTRSRYQPTMPKQKLQSFGTINNPLVIDDDEHLILSPPEHEEAMETDGNHGGQNDHNAGKHRANLSKGTYRSRSEQKRGSGCGGKNLKEVKDNEDERYNEEEDDSDCYGKNDLTAEKHLIDQLRSSGKGKSQAKRRRMNVEKKIKEKKYDDVMEQDPGDHDGNCGLDAKSCSIGQLKMSSKDVQNKVLEKGSKLEVPLKRRCISELKDHDVHEILLNSIMGSGELDTLLDELGETRKETSTAGEPLQWKFTFGIDQLNAFVEPVVDEELDILWKELDWCLANSRIGLSDSCLDSNGEATLAGMLTDQESLCRQGKHQLVLNEEIGLVCKFCPHVNLEIKHIMTPFSDHPFGNWRDYYGRVNHSVLHNPQLEDFGCNSLNIGDDRAFHQTGTVWDLIPGIKKGMYPHQSEGFEFLWRNIAGSTNLEELRGPEKLDQGGCIISHAPGTGKTRLAIVFILTYMKLYKESRPVIIAPSSMLLTWEEEFRKWNVGIPFHNLNTQEISGKEDTRVLGLLKRHQDMRKVRLAKLFSWERNESILGISYRLFSQLVGVKICADLGNVCPTKKQHQILLDSENEKIRKMLLKLPGLLVLDEGHIPRNDESQIFTDLSRVETKKCIILSGTPFQNSLRELYNTLSLVRPGFPDMILSGKVPKDLQTRRGRKRANLGNRAFLHYMAKHVDELRARMKPFVHVHKGTVLQKTLPGIRDFVVVLQLSELQKNLLERCQERYKKGLDMDYRVSLVTLHPWLSTIFCEKDPTFFDCSSLEKVRADNHAGVKTKFLMELICLSKALDEKVLVFSQFIKPLLFIQEKLESLLDWHLGRDMDLMSGDLEDKQRQSMMSLFNNPSSTLRVLLASTRACSEGISLVGASRVVLLDTVWNPSVERQAIGRAYRIGQTRVVHVYHLIAAKTNEEEKQLRQIEKGRLSDLVFSSANYRENEEAKISAQVSQDMILDEMVRSEKLRCMFEKIYPLGADSTLVENFSWMEE
ncbi:hypothetical protein Dimus_008514 [Dionaea muscipula]